MTQPNQCPKCGAKPAEVTKRHTLYECASVVYTNAVLPFSQSHYCQLGQRIRELEKDRDHWKAAHDEMAARNKLLRNRPDLPLERVTGYDEIMQQLAAERAKVAKLREALLYNIDYEQCQYDHNDFCQEHYSERPCRNQVAREVLEETK